MDMYEQLAGAKDSARSLDIEKTAMAEREVSSPALAAAQSHALRLTIYHCTAAIVAALEHQAPEAHVFNVAPDLSKIDPAALARTMAFRCREGAVVPESEQLGPIAVREGRAQAQAIAFDVKTAVRGLTRDEQLALIHDLARDVGADE